MNVGDSKQEVFSCYIAPYAKKDTRGVTVNWHCFDIDLSCYTTSGNNWRSGLAQQGHITIFPVTSTSSSVTLTGSLLGSIKGTITDPQVIETGGGNSMSGVCSTLSTIGGLLGGSVSSSTATSSSLGPSRCLRRFGSLGIGVGISICLSFPIRMAPSPSGEPEGGFREAEEGLWIVRRAPVDSLNLSFASTSCPKARHRLGEPSALRCRAFAVSSPRARQFS